MKDKATNTYVYQEQPNTGLELEPESAVTDKYIYISLSKSWGDIQFRQGMTDTKGGLSFEPPSGSEIVVAFVRPGKEAVEEEQRSNTLTENELLEFHKKIRDLNKKLTEIDNNYTF